MKRCLIGVTDISQRLRHDLKEHVIDTRQYLRSASEVLIQFDLLEQAFFFRIGHILVQEQLRFCQSELVNTLFHITDHEHVRRTEPLPGNCPDQCFLHFIAVLVLIHQDLFIEFCQLICHRSRCVICRTSSQNFQYKMFQIVEIHQILLTFCDGKPLRKRLCQLQKHENRLLTCLYVRKHLLHTAKHIALLHVLDCILHLIANSGCQLLFLRIYGFIAGCCQTGEIQTIEDPIDLPVSLCFCQPFHVHLVFR